MLQVTQKASKKTLIICIVSSMVFLTTAVVADHAEDNSFIICQVSTASPNIYLILTKANMPRENQQVAVCKIDKDGSSYYTCMCENHFWKYFNANAYTSKKFQVCESEIKQQNYAEYGYCYPQTDWARFVKN